MTILPIPSGAGFGRLRHTFVKAIIDSNDPGAEPDFVPAVGTIKFIPEVPETIAYDAAPGLSVIPDPITVELDATGSFDEMFVATDVGNPKDWTYRIEFNILGASIKPFSIAIPAGSDRTMTEFLPTSSSEGVLTLRGPAGDAGLPGEGSITNDNLAIVGDSYAQAVGAGGTGFAELLSLILDRPKTIIDGNSGLRVDQLVPRVQTVLTQGKFKTFVVEAGLNDAIQSHPLATTKTAYLAIRDVVRQAGAIPVFTTVPPHFQEAVTARSRPLNAWLIDNAAKEGWVVVDLHELVDPLTGNMRADLRYDDIHLNAFGHAVIAEAIRDKISHMYRPSSRRLPIYSGARFDSVLGSNQLFTGQVWDGMPAGWDVMNGVASASATPSVIDPIPGPHDGWKGKVFRIQMGAAGGGHAVKRWSGANSIVPGNRYAIVGRLRLSQMLEVASGDGVSVQLRWGNGDITYVAGMFQYDRDDFILDYEFTAPAGATAVDVTFYIALGAGSGIVDIGQVDLINLNARAAG